MTRLIALGICLLIVGSIAVAHLTRKSESVPIQAFDSWGNICWNFERARLDNFAINLQHESSVLGYIVVYAGRESCADEAITRAVRAKKWLEKRGVPANRILWINGGFQEQTETQLWIWPIGQGVFPVDPQLTEREVTILHTCKGKILNPAKCK